MNLLYAKTNALLIGTQQFLDQCNMTMSLGEKKTVLQALTSCVDVTDRCKSIRECDGTRKFPLVTGECNNLEHPKWGSQFTPYSRLLAASYDDGIHSIRKSVTRDPLPSPRLLGNDLLKESAYPFNPPEVQNYNSLLFGQVIAHDCGLRDVYQNSK